MSFLQLMPIFCALLFAFTRGINLRVTKEYKLTVKINLNIFVIILTEEKIKKRGIKKAARLFKSFKNLVKPIKYLVSKTEVRIYRLPYLIRSDIALESLYNLSFLASLGVVFSYLENNARIVRFINRQKCNKDDYQAFFDLSLHFSLWNLIIFAFLFLYYTVKNKVKRVIKNV